MLDDYIIPFNSASTLTIPCASPSNMQNLDISDGSCIEITMPADANSQGMDCYVKLTMDPASELNMEVVNYANTVRLYFYSVLLVTELKAFKNVIPSHFFSGLMI